MYSGHQGLLLVRQARLPLVVVLELSKEPIVYAHTEV